MWWSVELSECFFVQLYAKTHKDGDKSCDWGEATVGRWWSILLLAETVKEARPFCVV